MFEEGIALLMLKGWDPFLKSLIHERENEEILPSGPLLLRQCIIVPYTAYILAMIHHQWSTTMMTRQ